MTSPHLPSYPTSPITTGSYPVVHAPAAETGDTGYPIYTSVFAADPYSAYREMREEYGSVVPVEIAPGVPATLIIKHATAVRILNDPEHFPADPRYWQESVPQDSPVLPMMQWLPAARNNTGELHHRYRQASVWSIDGVDLNTLPGMVERVATPLINGFCAAGTADLMMDYALPLALENINQICGTPPEQGAATAQGMALRFDSQQANVEEGMRLLKTALMELIQIKRDQPGDDATSRLIAAYQSTREPAKPLDDREVFGQLMSFYGAGFECQRNLIANGLLLMITDPRYRPGSDLGGNLSTDHAIDNVLFNDPPMANFCTTYPRQPIMVEDHWLPAHQPVLISLAGCNNDPALREGDEAAASFVGNESHLAWSVGPHACPAKSLARTLVRTSIDYLFTLIPDMQLACAPEEVPWRPGPFHRALATLPVVFDPAPPMPPP